MNLNIKDFFKRNWVYFLAIAIFFVTTFAYFSPQFSGHSLKQHDIKQFAGMVHETVEFREKTGEQPFWTNSMFGGMPTHQISTQYDGNLLIKAKRFLGLWLNYPAGIFFTYLTGFFIMLLCFRVNKWIAIAGALAFAFSSYYLIILQAGHNSKAMAIALSPPVIGAFYMAFRHNLKWGAILSALFMGMEISANHLQITYYLAIPLLLMGLVEFIRVIEKKIELKKFLLTTIALIVAYGFAVGINYGNISFTSEYAKYTIRGENDIKVNPDGTSASGIQSKGLDKDYITQWSNGIGESMTLISPYVKGGGSAAIANSQFADKLKDKEFRKNAPDLSQQMMYWGDQPIVSGPVYLGIVVVFLALLGMIFITDRIKWALFFATVLCVMLSWGKNYMGLTEFFIDYVPGYNKFRAVTIILSIVELIIPLLGILFLNKLVKEKEQIKAKIKHFYIVSGSCLALLLIFAFVGTGDDFLSERERDYVYGMPDQIEAQISQMPAQQAKEQYGVDINNPVQKKQFINQVVQNQTKSFDVLKEFRAQIAKESYLRSFAFLLVAALLIFAFIKYKVKVEILALGIAVLALADLVSVDRNYLSSKKEGRSYKYWVSNLEKKYPYQANQADMQILQNEISQNAELKKIVDEASKAAENKDLRRESGYNNYITAKKFSALNANSNYRVFEPSGATNSSRASYFHKSMGGYHGAKLRNIQNLYNFQISLGNYKVFDMFNVKYFINRDQQGNYNAQFNQNALGNAWFVNEFQIEGGAEAEMRALGKQVKISNTGEGQLIVNGNITSTDTVYGAESIVYFVSGDSIQVDIQKTFRTDAASSFVADVNGRTQWVPNRTLEMDSTNSFKVLIKQEVFDNFYPGKEAIITPDTYAKLEGEKLSGEGSIKMTSYAPNKLTYDINTSSKQFAVFSEVYYPDGWNAYIDGEKVDIEKTDYLLRGVIIPANSKELVMKFDVPSFRKVNNISLILCILLFLVIIGAGVMEFKRG